jgi:hypothetical protein
MRLILMILACSVAGAAVASDAAGCLGGRKQALLDGHFTGPIVCSATDATFQRVGTTQGYGYTIYDYRFLTNGGAAAPWGQKVVIFHGSVYIGQYDLSPPPFAAMLVNESQLVLGVDEVDEVSLELSSVPPAEVYLNGKIERFHR